MHKTSVFVIFSLHSSVFHHRTERFVKFDAVLHHDIYICSVNKLQYDGSKDDLDWRINFRYLNFI